MPRKKQTIHDRMKSTNTRVMSKALKEFGVVQERIKQHAVENLGKRVDVVVSWMSFTFRAEIRLPPIGDGLAPVIVSVMHPDLVNFEALTRSNVDLMQIAAEDFLENTDEDTFATSEFAESAIAEYRQQALA